jgi:hypothetical protein
MNKDKAILKAEKSIYTKQEKHNWYLIINHEEKHKIQLIDKRAATWLCGLYKVQLAMKLMGHLDATIASASIKYSNYEDIGRWWTNYVLDINGNI